MTTLLLTHPASLDHHAGYGHPERPERIQAIERALEDERFALLIRESAPLVAREALLRVHPEPYVAAIEGVAPQEGLRRLDADTAMSPGTLEAARRAAGGAVLAVDEVMSGRC